MNPMSVKIRSIKKRNVYLSINSKFNVSSKIKTVASIIKKETKMNNKYLYTLFMSKFNLKRL